MINKNSENEIREAEILHNYIVDKFRKNFFLGLSLRDDEEYFNSLLLKYPNNPSMLIAKGYLEWAFGDKSKASNLFDRAYTGAALTGYKLRWFELGVNSFLGHSHTESEIRNLNPFFINLEKIVVKRNDDQKPIILTSCDEVYFNKFGRSFININLKHSSNNVHIHLLNPSAETINYFNRISSSRVTFSIENTVNTWPSYYALSRFLIAQIIIKKFNVNIFISDIDQVLSRRIDHIIRSLNSDTGDIFLDTLKRSWMPWNYHLGGNVYLKNNPIVMAFLTYFSSYVTATIARLRTLENAWFIDQNALYHSVLFITNSYSAKIDSINKFGKTGFGADGLKKDIFSGLMCEYDDLTDFEGRLIINDPNEFSKKIGPFLKNRNLAQMVFDAFYKKPN